ncbi:hypothetical protein ETC03_11120 [Geobacillus sp. MMMUD3]|nr:hypothetical protein [Geobacillus sp. MMMUD3]
MGVATCFLTEGAANLHIEEGAKLAVRLHVPTCIEELKLKLSEG